ncbi:hypothetical protein MLD38_015872 [Melastoma candidum]|uniref:Uncharacterized protein n=1 Tax=Melastoma candidum TaxID=119954 RepID=A0ACB9RHL1_9MYRT|nr:hypothetical protein MLD38_015872 [Melastoma candidum]
MRHPSGSTISGSTSAGKTVTPCCSKVGIKRGPWTPEEDEILANYVKKEGEGRWRTLPKKAGLLRCGKSCRLRWMNYLRPSVKRGRITPDEEDLILRLHRLLGNRWALIAGRIPGRTDNEIKNYWNTHLSKKLISQGIDPRTHKPLQNWNPGPDDDPGGSMVSVTPSHDLNPKPNPGVANDPRRDQASTSGIVDYGDLCLETQHENWEKYLENNNEDVLSSFLDSLMNDDPIALRQLRNAVAIGPPSPLPPTFPAHSSFNPSTNNGMTSGQAGFGSSTGELKSAHPSNAAYGRHA